MARYIRWKFRVMISVVAYNMSWDFRHTVPELA
jgi:hypothetical protein